MDESKALVRAENWKPKTILVGAFLGALVGAVGAYLYIQSSENDTPPQFSAKQGVKLGMLVLGLLRSISSIKG